MIITWSIPIRKNLYLTQAVAFDDAAFMVCHHLIPVSYAQIDLKLQCRRKKLILTTKPALVNRMIVVCINGRFNMLGCSSNRHTIHHFRFIRFEKATSYLYLLISAGKPCG